MHTAELLLQGPAFHVEVARVATELATSAFRANLRGTGSTTDESQKHEPATKSGSTWGYEVWHRVI
jgi:hypothetical protein